jgi:hypothetical protein
VVTLASISFLLLFHYGARKGKPILSVIAGIILLIAPLTLDIIFHEYKEVIKRIEDYESSQPKLQNQSLKRKIT